MEGVDDAHDGAEEADEGSALGGGREPGHAAFHDGERLGGGGLGGALEGLGVGGWPRPPAWRWYSSWISWKTATSGEGLNWSAIAAISERRPDLRKARRKRLDLDVGLVEGAPLGDDDGPGDDAGDEQDSEDGERGGAAVVDHVHDARWNAGRREDQRALRVLQEESEGEDGHMLRFSVNASEGSAVLARNGRRYGVVVVRGIPSGAKAPIGYGTDGLVRFNTESFFRSEEIRGCYALGDETPKCCWSCARKIMR